MNYYDQEADKMAETLFDNGLDLERFIPALMRAVKSHAERIVAESADYDSAHVNWAEEQIREAKLYLETLGEAMSELGAAISQSLASDDEIIVSHMKVAKALLCNLKRRMETA